MSETPKQVIITGGTRGLGLAIGVAQGQLGNAVLALYHQDHTAAARTMAIFDRENINGHCQLWDATSDASFPHHALLHDHELVVIHNACPRFQPQPFHHQKWHEWFEQWQTAVKGAWSLVDSTIRPMLAQKKGTFVTILSQVVTETPPKGFAAYTSAKFALLGLTKSLAVEYGPLGVRAFSVAPGLMNTSLTQQWHPHVRQAILGQQPLCDTARAAQTISDLIAKDTAKNGAFYHLEGLAATPCLYRTAPENQRDFFQG